MLVEHFADLRHLSRVPLYDRPDLLRSAVIVDALAETYGAENYRHPTGGAELIADLEHGLGTSSLAAVDAANLADEVVHIEKHYSGGSPDRAAMVSDLARRLVEAVRS